jgi:two-component system, response regulator, stage 0 sporulation protein F
MDKNILVVDDEKEVTRSLEGFFSALGYKILGAFNGEEALEIIKTRRLDLILLDIRMPGIDGRDVLKRVKKDNPTIKTIVFTAYGKQYKDEVEKLGVDSFFTKPLNLSKLIETIQTLIGPDAAIKPPTEPIHVEETKGIPKAKILFIQPSPMTYGFTCGYFAGHDNLAGGDYDVRVSYDVKEALNLIYSYQPDIVVMYDCFFNPDDAKEFGGLMMKSSHKPKSVILHGLIPRTQFQVMELEQNGIQFCNQNTMNDENLRATNKKLVDYVNQECIKHKLLK